MLRSLSSARSSKADAQRCTAAALSRSKGAAAGQSQASAGGDSATVGRQALFSRMFSAQQRRPGRMQSVLEGQLPGSGSSVRMARTAGPAQGMQSKRCQGRTAQGKTVTGGRGQALLVLLAATKHLGCHSNNGSSLAAQLERSGDASSELHAERRKQGTLIRHRQHLMSMAEAVLVCLLIACQMAHKQVFGCLIGESDNMDPALPCLVDAAGLLVWRAHDAAAGHHSTHNKPAIWITCTVVARGLFCHARGPCHQCTQLVYMESPAWN